MFHYCLIFILLQITNAVTAQTNTTNCTQYNENFGKAVATFTLCSISNSHPIKLCELCIDNYIDVVGSYKNLSLYSDTRGQCILHYVNLDRLGIVVTMYQNVYDLWNRAKCYECFEVINGELTHNKSNETIKFNDLYDKNQKCINKTYNKVSDMCNNCMDSYLSLSDFYNGISDENAKIGMCMDIVDLMNTTRMFWSEKCCRYRHHDEYGFIASVTVLCFITMMFYILTKLLIDKKSPRIFMQSRFAESLSSSSRK